MLQSIDFSEIKHIPIFKINDRCEQIYNVLFMISKSVTNLICDYSKNHFLGRIKKFYLIC